MKIEDRNWSGKITHDNKEAIHTEITKLFSEAALCVVAATITPTGEYDVNVSTGENPEVSGLHDHGFSISAQNYLYPIDTRMFLKLKHDRLIVQGKTGSGNHLHWEFVKEKG